MITVYFWAPDISIGNVGHISLKIGVGQAKGLETYVSWWPGSNDGNKFNDPVRPYTYDMDVEAERKEPTSNLSLSGLNEAAMKRSWEHMLANKPRYFLLRKNCAWTVKTLLDVGTGYDLRAAATDAINWRISGGIWAPRAVFEYARLLKTRYNAKSVAAIGSSKASIDPYSIRIA